MNRLGDKTIAAVFRSVNPTLFWLGVIPFLIAVIPMINLFNSSLTVFPAEGLGNRVSAITDGIWNGKSKIQEFSYDKNAMRLRYILKEGIPSPLVFVTINLGLVEKPLDLSRYDSVTLRIRKATSKRIMVFIKTYVPGVSLPEPEKGYTLRHNQYILQLVPGQRQYSINLRDFITPPWWIERMKVNQALIPAESFQKVLAFDMQFNQEGSDYIINKPEKIIIEEIAFHRRLSPLDYMLIGLATLCCAGLSVYLLRKGLKKESEKLPRRKTLDLSSYREKELLQIKAFVEGNYHIANISTQTVSESLGIPSARIYELLKEEYRLTFKQLINKLRIDEAKRLLKETDLRVTEIALNLGFNNVSYFNNLFKTYEGTTPSDYREKEKRQPEKQG